MFYKNKIINVNKNNSIEENENETLREFYIKNYSILNDKAKIFLENKEEFDEKNKDITYNMSEKEYENNLKEDYKKVINEEFGIFFDFDENDYEGDD